MKPLLSVITVTFDDHSGLRRTLESLAVISSQAGSDLEVLIVDGGSGAGMAALRRDFPWADIRSEPDDGIYDAMNKGLQRSSGRSVWFLNGGDECCLTSWDDIAEPLVNSPGMVLLAGYFLLIGRRSLLRMPRKPSYIWHGLPTSHQAIFYPGDKARELRYCLNFSLVGDYDFTARMFKYQVQAKRLNLPVSRFHMDGVSFKHAYLVAREARLVQRETLGTPLLLQYVSRTRHALSRNFRRLQSNTWA